MTAQGWMLLVLVGKRPTHGRAKLIIAYTKEPLEAGVAGTTARGTTCIDAQRAALIGSKSSSGPTPEKL